MSSSSFFHFYQTGIDYVNVGKTPVIHSFGREPSNWLVRKHVAIHGFEPYFYISNFSIVSGPSVKSVSMDPRYRISLDNVPVKKVVTHIPADVPRLKDEQLKNERTFQSKVVFPLNFMCTTGLKSSFSVRPSDIKVPLKKMQFTPDYVVSDYKKIIPSNNIYIPPLVLMLDIETDNRESNPSIGRPDQEITMVCFRDTYTRYKYSFAWHPDVNKKKTIVKKYPYMYSGLEIPWKIFLFDNEIEMLYEIKNFLVKVNPDIYTAWNVNFDMGYLIGRFDEVGIKPEFLSPVGEVKVVSMKNESGDVIGYTPVIKGTTILDMLYCYKSLTKFDGMKDSYALDDVGHDELRLEKVSHEGSVGKFWHDQFAKCLHYNARDLEIIYEINDKLKIMDYHNVLREQTGCQFEDTIFTSRIIETEVLRKAISVGKVVPTNIRKPKSKKFRGAVVFDPEIGRHVIVILIDLKALYPSIIMTLNISPETRVDSEKLSEEEKKNLIRSSAGKYYRKDIVGIAKDCLMDMNRQRDMYKACKQIMAMLSEEKKKIDFSSGKTICSSLISIIDRAWNERKVIDKKAVDLCISNINGINFDGKNEKDVLKILKSEKLKYDLTQKAEKAKINTWYGVMGLEGSSLYNVDDAESVTLSGRDIIIHSSNVVNSIGMREELKRNFGVDCKPRVIYGDTDSVYIAGFETIKDFETMCKVSDFVGKYVTKSYDAFCKEKFNADLHYLSIRAEEFAKVFCLSPLKESSGKEDEEGAKKRYWYLPWGTLEGEREWIEYKGRDIKVKGFETRRSNVARIGRRVQKKVMEYISFYEEDKIADYLKEMKLNVHSGKMDLEELCFNVSISEVESYAAVKKGGSPSSWPEHVRASYWGNLYFKQDWKTGDKVKTIYVKDSPRGLPKMDVIGVRNAKVPPNFKVDYKKIWEKQVQERLPSVLATVNLTYTELITGMKNEEL